MSPQSPLRLAALPAGRDTRRALRPDHSGRAKRRRVILVALALLVDGLASGPTLGVVAGPLGGLALAAGSLLAAEAARRLRCRGALAWAAGLTGLVAGLWLGLPGRTALALTLGGATALARARRGRHPGRALRRRLVALVGLAGACAVLPAAAWLVGLTALLVLALPAGGRRARRAAVRGSGLQPRPAAAGPSAMAEVGAERPRQARAMAG